jgi:osmotically-inducible protein OsmY
MYDARIRIADGCRRWRAGALAVLVAGALGIAPSVSAATTSHALDDSDIRSAVEDEFLTDATVPFNTLDVAVQRGVVTLTGTVDTLLARRRAVDLARAIKGVRSVVDEVTVEAVRRTDDALRRDVAQAIAADPAAHDYTVAVAVKDGVATLSGKVDSWAEKQIVQRVAEGVRGVRNVRNELTLAATTPRSDAEIAAEIRSRLSWDARVDDGLIRVAVDNGTARLTGTVGSALERARAQQLAWVPGVKKVDAAGLDVEWWARNEMRRDKYAPRSDAQVQKAIEAAFLYDPRVASFNPEVKVDDGVATLSGTVDNLDARHAAGSDARDTVGVVLVRNHLHVRPPREASDEMITEEVRQAIARDPLVDRFGVGVATFRGQVSLAGDVDSLLEKDRAGRIASGIDGVVAVHNDIQVRYRPIPRSDVAIKQNIKDEIAWSPFVDSDDIHVTVHDGVATLTGTVDNWADYSWAAENARQAGASAVRNQLQVRNDKGAVWMPY